MDTGSNLAFLARRDEVPAYWMYDILWVPLIEAQRTGGSFSVIEQWMRGGSGVRVPHVHPFCDEWFCVLEGSLDFTIDGEALPARAGDNVWVARGTPHSFVVTSPVCRILNGYTPGGFEQVIKHLAAPALARELPPPDWPPPDERTLRLIFNNDWTREVGAEGARA